MRFILGALAAATLFVGIGAAQPADARCFWNGAVMQCYHPYHHGWWRWHHRHHWRY